MQAGRSSSVTCDLPHTWDFTTTCFVSDMQTLMDVLAGR